MTLTSRLLAALMLHCLLSISFLHIYQIKSQMRREIVEIKTTSTSSFYVDRVPVFYNVYVNPQATKITEEIIKEQMSQMRSEHIVFVRSIGVILNITNAIHLQHGETGSEVDTLRLLWNYCSKNPGGRVIYIHSKGSFHPRPENHRLRRFLTAGALSSQCTQLPRDCDVCSSRMSPLPHPHTSGNMWSARCNYVRKLIDPLEISKKVLELYPSDFTRKSCVGGGRYAAEHWVYSHPSVRPCDLYSGDNYTWNYDDVPVPNFEKKLEPAPRFEFKKYKKEKVCPPYLLNTRLREYKALYDQTPAESWWGWKFYNISKEEGEWCYCLDCPNDQACGGLWHAKRFPTIDSKTKEKKRAHVHIIVSHCKSDLKWISNFTYGHEILSIHVISKCGEEVTGAPENAIIQSLPNVGRCDHSYVYYIKYILQKHVEKDLEKNTVVFFMKDDVSEANKHQRGDWNDFETILTLASSTNGFSCGISEAVSSHREKNWRKSYSAFHVTTALFGFTIDEYSRNIKNYPRDKSNFQSNFSNLGSFMNFITSGKTSYPELVQVCYGGVFASSYLNIKRIESSIWEKAEIALSRGNSIQEGHYMERAWAPLLATPNLEPYQIDSLRNISNGDVATFPCTGALIKKLRNVHPRYYKWYWKDLPATQRLAAEALGFEMDTWNHGMWPRGLHLKYWNESSIEMQNSLLSLGYKQQSWDESTWRRLKNM